MPTSKGGHISIGEWLDEMRNTSEPLTRMLVACIFCVKFFLL